MYKPGISKVELFCPLSGQMLRCKVEKCAFWDKDMNYKGKTGGCLVVRLARDIGEIREKIK